MAIIDMLLPRKKRTSETISKELAAQAGTLAEARNRVELAKKAREAAIDALDKPAMKAADEAQADAERDVTLAERAITALQTAHSEALESEAREAFLNEVAEYQADANELANRLENDYPALAAGIGAILDDLRTLGGLAHELQARAQKLGVSVTLRNPEDVRRSAATRYSATWPNPEGSGVIQGPAQDAPRGCVRWVDGVPTAAREGVRVITHRPEPLASLLETVGNLPPLHQSEPYFFARGAERKAGSVADVATAKAFGEAVRGHEAYQDARREIVSTFPTNLVKALPKW